MVESAAFLTTLTRVTQLVQNSPDGRPQTPPDDWGLFPQFRATKSSRFSGHGKPLRTLADGSELPLNQRVRRRMRMQLLPMIRPKPG